MLTIFVDGSERSEFTRLHGSPGICVPERRMYLQPRLDPRFLYSVKRNKADVWQSGTWV